MNYSSPKHYDSCICAINANQQHQKQNFKNKTNYSAIVVAKTYHKKRNSIFNQYQIVKFKQQIIDKNANNRKIHNYNLTEIYQSREVQRYVGQDGMRQRKKLKIFDKKQLNDNKQTISSTKRLINKIYTLLPLQQEQNHIENSIIIQQHQINQNCQGNRCEVACHDKGSYQYRNDKEHQIYHHYYKAEDTQHFLLDKFSPISNFQPISCSIQDPSSLRQKQCLTFSQHLNPIFRKIKKLKQTQQTTNDMDSNKRQKLKLSQSLTKKNIIIPPAQYSSQNMKPIYPIADKNRDIFSKINAQLTNIQMNSYRYFDVQDKITPLNKKLSFKDIKIQKLDENENDEEHNHNIFNDFQRELSVQPSIQRLLTTNGDNQQMRPLLKRTQSQIINIDQINKNMTNNVVNTDSNHKKISKIKDHNATEQKNREMIITEQKQHKIHQNNRRYNILQMKLSWFLFLLAGLLLLIQIIN